MRQQQIVRSLLVVWYLLTVASEVSAQTSANNIVGVVRDATAAVLPGVSVEVTSPALIEKVRASITDAEGQYRILSLPPGMYTVTFTLQGFNKVTREGIQLTANFTATVNAELRVGSIEESITVRGESPIVDMENTATRNVISRDVVDSVPTGKAIAGYASLTPGIILPATAQDVGGSRGEQLVYMTIHGSSTRDAKWNQEGFETNYASSGRTYVVNPAFQEMSIDLGGGSAEAKLGGVQVNVIPKTGANTFAGDLFWTYANEGFQNGNASDELLSRGLNEDNINRLKYMWDANASLGGPVKRDKLWFYSSYRTWGSAAYVAGLLHNKDPQSVKYEPDTTRPAPVNDFSNYHGTMRLTWQISEKHKVNLSHDNQTRYDPHRGISATTSPEATLNVVFIPVMINQAVWTFPMTNRLLFEGGFSATSLHADFRRPEGTSDVLPSIRESSTGISYRSRFATSGTGAYKDSFIHKYQTRFATSYIVGSHSFKAGFDWLVERDGQYYYINSDTAYTFRNSVPTSISIFTTPLDVRDNTDADLGLFAQDQWKLKRLTLNYGLRFDYLSMGSPAQRMPAARFRGPLNLDAVTCGPCYSDLSPRMSASYDVFGNAKTALKFSLGRYVIGRPEAPLNNPARNIVSVADRAWDDANRDFTPQENELGPLSNSRFGQSVITTRYDDELLKGFGIRQANWQTSASFQHELRSGMAVTASYFRTTWHNFEVTDNLLVGPEDFDPFCISLPVDTRLPGSGQALCGFYNINPTRFGQVDNLVVNGDRFGKQTNVYNGVDLGFRARLPGGGFFAAGSSTGRQETSRCFVVDSPQDLQFCKVSPPFQTQVKIHGSYPLPWDFQVSGNFQTLPGIPISASFVATNAQVAPTLGRSLSGSASTVTIPNIIEPQTQFEGRINQFDLRLTKTIRVGRTRLHGMFDIFNVLNASPILAINTRYGPSWLSPTQILDARSFRFGVQMNF
jgi:hypothetical protein